MPDYKWPDIRDRKILGGRHSRLDGPDKVRGQAKYTSDIKLPGMLYARFLRSPYAHAKVVSIDTSVAEKMPGVKRVKVLAKPGTEIQWAFDDVAVVVAADERTAADALAKIQVQYEKLPHCVDEIDYAKVPASQMKKPSEQVKGDPDKAFSEADVISEGEYGVSVVTHCTMEPHGNVSSWDATQNLTVYPSTQNVSGLTQEFSQALKIPTSNVHIKMDHIGGGFGSKFEADSWGLEAARLSQETGKPVRAFLERDAELAQAGNRPSAFAKVKVGAKKDGTIVAWESEAWGTDGPSGGMATPNTVLPYVFNIPNQRKKATGIATHTGPARAWRAPNHPQACTLTMAALDDLAAKIGMNSLDFFIKNLSLAQPRGALYEKELRKAAELMEWNQRWHPRGDPSSGYLKRGVGLSLHTWGGAGHDSEARIVINPDGSVTVSIGSQDLGTGTRTIIAMVAAETFGLPINAVAVNIGRAPEYPNSGASGGSTTVGGVSSSTRRGALNALEALFAKVAPTLGVSPDQLEAKGEKIQVVTEPSKNLSWKQACSKLGVNPISASGKNPGAGRLTTGGVGGVQMAAVAVDVETGVVRMEKFVAVQDCGLVINEKTAESQVYGAMIMGICYSLMEERVMDKFSGRPLNANMEFYKLAGIGDIGELVVHMWKDAEQDARGVIGLGEPPVISPGAAIGNAIANAIGVRVPRAPFTPARVLAALQNKGGLTL
jgi:xanthine dehydrogenase YagR molybdenum-binding subunit